MKVKPSKNMLYTIKANVFAVKLGPEFGRTAHTTVVANNDEDAIEQGKKSFTNLCATLEKNHNNTFNFTDLTIE